MKIEQFFFLNPGDLVLSDQGEILTTILGSCVSICIYSPKKNIGGMTHFMLPSPNEENISEPNKYGNLSTINLLKKFKDYGCKPNELEAKVVGGAAVSENLSNVQIGKLNIEMALATLSKFKIKISSQDVGGLVGRKIRFNTANGELFIAKNKKIATNTVKNVINNVFLPENSSIENKIAPIQNMNQPIKVLIVDDSASMQKMLTHAISSDNRFKVVQCASSSKEADKLIAQFRPDVITLDLHMPNETGVEFLRRHRNGGLPPVLIVTSYNINESHEVLEALDLGAVDCIEKPSLTAIDDFRNNIQNKLFDISKIKIKKKIVISSKNTGSSYFTDRSINDGVILIGSSTGGTEALREVLTRLPEKIPPILIVQHIPAVFSKSLAERLNQLCKFEVKEAVNGEVVRSGTVYIAPGGNQMRVRAKGKELYIDINDDPPMNLFKPSVDYLFGSMLKINNRKIVAAILTGMGADGAQEMLNLKKNGALTIGQDEASSVVYGMPKIAFEIGALDKVANLYEIPSELIQMMNRRA